MAHPRFFLDSDFDGGRVPLTERDMHHARHVLRLVPGETVVVVTPAGRALRVRLDEIGESVTGTVTEELPPDSGPRVWLVLAMPKGERADLAVRMAVELGCAGVVPMLSERTVVRLEGQRRHARGDRLRRVALEAAKQSQRSSVPYITDPVPLDEMRGLLPERCRVVVPWEEASGPGIRAAIAEAPGTPGDPLAVVIGPEGGFAAFEVAALREAGAVVCSLGPTVLRTETAAVVAVTLAMHALGGLGGTDD